MGAWLIKSEPSVYSFANLEKDKRTVWDGIRSFEARNNLRAMKRGDICLFYHSNEGKEVVGVAKVVKEPYADPTDDEWTVVEVAAVTPLKQPVSLADIKKNPALADMALVRKSRLSVGPVTDAELRAVLKAGKTTLK
jgi:predicted RNA-binding protein with PUA-like domain